MSDNRKYYYLKLKENYFDDDSIVLLESMQDGVLYSNILLKLYLKSLKHGGRLQLDEDIPYTAQMIATITRQQIGTKGQAAFSYPLELHISSFPVGSEDPHTAIWRTVLCKPPAVPVPKDVPRTSSPDSRNLRDNRLFFPLRLILLPVT